MLPEQTVKRTAEEMVKPPFPNKMTFKEMMTNLFNLDFMSEEEKQTIFDAGEMYANGCLKQEATRSQILIEALEWIKNNIWYSPSEYIIKQIDSALSSYNNSINNQTCDAMGHYGGSKPEGTCPKCGKNW